MRPVRAIAAMVTVIVAGLLSVEQTKAVAVYTYTGNFFDTFQDETPPAGAYDNSMRLTGWFSIASPLAANLVDAAIDPDVLDFSFFDGREHHTKAISSAFFSDFSTDAGGNIIQWRLSGAKGSLNHVGDQAPFFFTNFTLDLGAADGGKISRCVSGDANGFCFVFAIAVDFGGVGNSPGSWTLRLPETTLSETPLPGTLPLFATGIAALGLVICRRRKMLRGMPESAGC